MIRIFVVDDEEVIVTGIRNAIANLPGNRYEVCGEARDGESAWPMLLEAKPDVVLADVCMPFMNGLELAKIVKKTLPQTRFIIISGHDEFEYAQEAVSAGVDAYVLKPINSKKLMDILEAQETSQPIVQEPSEQLLQTLSKGDAGQRVGGGFVSSHDVSSLESKLRYASLEDAQQVYDSYFQTANDDSAESVLLRYYLLMNLIMVTEKSLKKCGQPCESMSAVSILSVAGSWEQTHEVALDYIRRCIAARDVTQQVDMSREVLRAKQYIDAHFCDTEISLQTVASVAGFSPSYFSTLFAQEMDMSFTEYLTRRRMEHAKELLAHSQESLQELCQQVGYSDPYYFSQVFKKYFGVSPKEFQSTK